MRDDQQTGGDLQELREAGPIRVWSLIVTIFGDLGALHAGTIPGPALNTLLGRIGVRPDAARVALHRLRKDGWIVSERTGRTSLHALTPMARAETEAARERVYGGKVPERAALILAAYSGGTSDPGSLGVCIGPNLFLEHEGAAPDAALRLPVGEADLPDWVGAGLLPAHMAEAAVALPLALSRLGDAVVEGSALDRMARRVLVLHHWRRLALREGTWMHASLWPDGPAARCRAAVAETLGALPPEPW